MTTRQTAISIPVAPWFQDHRFAGHIVFPAVETLQILAAAAARIDPGRDCTRMTQARFAKLLPVPEGAATLPALVEWSETEAGLTVRLLSRVQGKAVARLLAHGEVTFPGHGEAGPGGGVMRETPAQGCRISAERIYDELVPFGPSYRTLTGDLALLGNEAWGTLTSPDLPAVSPVQAVLGSPFPLDGAMHAACVLGQTLADFVPFPVGFGARRIERPTRSGKNYLTQVMLRSRTPEELLFDLGIFDEKGRRCEAVAALRMRDVSGGRIGPPGWIRGLAGCGSA